MSKPSQPVSSRRRRLAAVAGGVVLAWVVLVVVLARRPEPTAPAEPPRERSGDFVTALEEFRIDDAEAALVAQLERNPASPRARYELRWLLFNQFRQREVEALLEDGLRRFPQEFSYAVDLLMSEFRPQVPREVLGYWENVNRRRPGQANVLLALGYCHWQLGEIERARQEFQAALDQRPDDPRVRMVVGEFLLELGEVATAAGLLLADAAAGETAPRSATAAGPPAPYEDRLWSLKSRLAAARGDVEQALDFNAQSLALRPAELRHLQQQGTLLRQLGRREEAAACFQQANRLEACIGRLTNIVLSGALDSPTPELCTELAELCERRGKTLQAATWRRAAAVVAQSKRGSP